MREGQFAGITGAPCRPPPPPPPPPLDLVVVVVAYEAVVVVGVECEVVVCRLPMFPILAVLVEVEVEDKDKEVEEREAQRLAAAARLLIPPTDRSRAGEKPSCFVALMCLCERPACRGLPARATPAKTESAMRVWRQTMVGLSQSGGGGRDR